MKFPDFKSGNSSVCHIDGISKGVTAQTNCRENKNLGLTNCNNVIFKGGYLRNRLGLSIFSEILLTIQNIRGKSTQPPKPRELK